MSAIDEARRLFERESERDRKLRSRFEPVFESEAAKRARALLERPKHSAVERFERLLMEKEPLPDPNIFIRRQAHCPGCRCNQKETEENA